jgi:hypothetical protein
MVERITMREGLYIYFSKENNLYLTNNTTYLPQVFNIANNTYNLVNSGAVRADELELVVVYRL